MELAQKSSPKKLSPEKKVEKKSFTVVAIGASAGGLEAFSLLLKNLPPDTGMAYIYVQHLSPNHKSLLTSILSKITKMKVQEIDNMEKMEPNNLYIIPPNKVIEVINGHIQLHPRIKKNVPNLTIDFLFSSLAETHKKNVIGIVLSGYASDGMIGLKAIKDAGGITFAQDDTAQASSMPKSAISSGVVDYILSPEEIAHKLVRISQNDFLLNDTKQKDKKEEIVVENNNYDLNAIFELLLKQTGVDFSHYKMPTIKRRVNHKMQQYGIKTIEEYAKLLFKKNNEIEILYTDLLINVTSFFRETETFKFLKTSLFPKLLNSKSSEETLRIWVPACSTGQEAYSIAMIISELQENKKNKTPVQIFATDLSEQAIRYARVGEYSQSDIDSIPKKYLSRFFTKEGDNYRIIKELREMCIFAPHNILRDPPFSRMDFVSCCNLLIYFDSAAQKKVFASLHFALNEGGSLMLGKAESIGTSSLLFTLINNKFKIYSRKNNLGVRKTFELTPRFTRTNMSNKKTNTTSKNISVNQESLENAIDSTLLTNYMPACAVVNKDMEILQFRGPISSYLEHASGKASLNILKMARPEFAFELRNTINRVIETKQSVYKSGIEIKIDSVLRLMSFEVCPLKIEWDEPLLLIIFKPQEQIEKFIESDSDGKNNATLKDIKIKKLTEELNTTRTEMITIIESQENIYEELQAANEEIVSSNEEFQTLNEELETSKEEIEATNEELISTNQELQMRHDLLIESHEYSEAIIATIHEPMLILNKNFHVISANKSFYKKFLVNKEETEGKLLFDLGNKQWNISKLREVLNEIIFKNSSFENFEVTHTFSEIGEKIMLLNAHLIIQKVNSEQLILLAIADVTDIRKLAIELQAKENIALVEQLEAEKKILKRIQDSKKYYRNLIQSLPVAVYTCDKNGYIQLYNKEAVELWGRKPEIGKDMWCGSFKISNTDGSSLPLDKCPMAIALKEERAVLEQEIIIERPNGEKRFVLPNPRTIFDEEGKLSGCINTLIDVTDQKRIESELIESKVFAELATLIAEEAKSKAEDATRIAEDAMKAKQQFLSNMSHEIRTPMNAIIGFTRVILKTDLTDKQKEYLNAIKMSGDTLIALINDILDLAKVDAGKMTFEQKPFEMEVSITSMLQLFETKIQEKNLKLVTNYDPKIPAVLLGDSIRLHQIILNLVSNAVKFTSQGKIIVSTSLLFEDEEKVIIEFAITDSGIGIPKDNIDLIFENFQQATNGSSSLYGGTGLGLAIVKQLVTSQGGSIRVKSKINEGSTFSFTLPFQKTKIDTELETTIKGLDTEVKNIKILVVEDMPLNQLLMKTILDDFGFERDVADNGKIAIEKLLVKSYDIILMDLQMPIMNGFETTDYIRNTMNLKIPIIALTADVTTVDLEKCKAVGMNDYIAKPIDEKLLFSKIVELTK
ncbi:response regulator [Flavobacterium ranwuense]|uniref:Response regulator n=1 Tax=Flavobacterium ranwuense TaxID=2541725 RepID=A0ABY2DTK5_9FLAO|nr:chemotaxis protein CheB [Flavobacterium ranwuense]TDE30566.1 response regulator [Flavobacterium ranwuense]